MSSPLPPASFVPAASLFFGVQLADRLILLALVLIPLGACFLKASSLSFQQFWDVAWTDRARSAYALTFGTSFAAAHVAGIAALMLAKNPQLGAEQVRQILTATARDLGPKGRDDAFGAGLADALKAVTAAVNSGGQTVASNGAAVP